MIEKILTMTAVLFLCLSAALRTAASLTLDGSDDPAFADAIEIWLDGSDRDSLPVLADLAAKGNTAARLFLSRIEREDRASSRFLDNLGPSGRRNLFRAAIEQKRMKPSWMQVLAKNGNPLASALMDAAAPTPNIDAIRKLRSMGEFQATDHPLRIVGFNGTQAERDEVISEGLVLPELVPYLLYHHETPEPQGDGLAALRHILGDKAPVLDGHDPDTLDMARLLGVGFGYTSLSPTNKWRRPVEQWLLSSPDMRPVADLCRQTCPSDPGGCAITIAALTAGYFEMIRMDSPLESVVPQDRFLKSARARRWTLRRAAFTAWEKTARPFPIEEIANYDRCVATMIKNERAG